MRKVVWLSLAGAVAALGVSAGGSLADEKHDMSLVPGSGAVKWQPGPPSLPKGVQIALLAGDPGKSGPFVLRVKFPSDSYVGPHSHATTENVTVLSGAILHGMGEKADKGRAAEVTAGGFVYLPGGMNHYLWTTSETVVQVTGTGPFGLQYVNPADDPSKSQ